MHVFAAIVVAFVAGAGLFGTVIQRHYDGYSSDIIHDVDVSATVEVARSGTPETVYVKSENQDVASFTLDKGLAVHGRMVTGNTTHYDTGRVTLYADNNTAAHSVALRAPLAPDGELSWRLPDRQGVPGSHLHIKVGSTDGQLAWAQHLTVTGATVPFIVRANQTAATRQALHLEQADNKIGLQISSASDETHTALKVRTNHQWVWPIVQLKNTVDMDGSHWFIDTAKANPTTHPCGSVTSAKPIESATVAGQAWIEKNVTANQWKVITATDMGKAVITVQFFSSAICWSDSGSIETS